MGLFKTVTIRTPESIELDFVLAGVGSRAVALVVDYACLGLGLLGLAVIYSFLLVQLLSMESVLGLDSRTIQLWLTAIGSLLAFGLYVGYFVLFETLWFGQTPGKRYSKIRVIRDDGQPERLLQATLRSLLRPIDDFLFIGFFCILLTQPEKRLGDWLAGTLVVQTDPKTPGPVQVPERSQAIGKDLLGLIDITQLSPDDLATIRAFLQRRTTLSRQAQVQVSDHLARRYKDQLGLVTLPTEMTTDTFLEALYWAYQQQPQR
ncbi:MAG TPA: RDD family protein [Leptolyngbyaceae cyanobacterium M65_K2018_010]|nr:RDD family protein [Leptolyngbyaceae cyanobacterium M65_K2018_010]